MEMEERSIQKNDGDREEPSGSYSITYRAQIAAITFIVAFFALVIFARTSFLGSVVFGGLGAFLAWTYGADMLEPFQELMKEAKGLRIRGKRGELVLPQSLDFPETSSPVLPIEQPQSNEMPPFPMKSMMTTTTTTMQLDDKVVVGGKNTAVLGPSFFQPQEEAPIFPSTREEDTLRWGTVYGTKSRFDPDFDRIFGQGIIIAATQGSGKSHILGRTIEQAAKGGIPAVVFDHKGEYHTIGELHQNAIRVGGTPDCKLVLTEEHEPQMGQLIAALFEQRLQLIIDLPTYGPGWSARARIIAMVTRSLMTYAEEQRLRKLPTLPCLVLYDEAQLYFPENASFLPPEATQDSRGMLSELKNACFAMVSNGRSNGYTVGFATQSLTYISKALIKTCQIHIYGRHVEKNDLDSIEKEIEESIATREEIKFFGQGQAIVTGLTREPVIVQFDRKESRDLSETPSLKRLRSTTTTGSLDQYLADYQQQPPRVIYTPAVQPSVSLTTITNTPGSKTGVLTQRIPPELQMALNVYVEGMSYRDFGRALGVGKDKAGEVMRELKERRLIS